MFKRLILSLLIGIILMIITACSDESSSDEVSQLTMGTSASGTTFYVVGAGLSQVLERETGIQINTETGGGSTTNIQLIEQGQMDLGLTIGSMAAVGWEGKDWAEGTEYKEMRTLFPVLTNYLHIWTLKDKGISSLDDLNGKNIATGAIGNSSEVTGNQIIDLFNIEPNSVVPLPTDQAVDGIKDGSIDVGFTTVGVPGPYMLDLETTHQPILINLEPDEISQILDAFPYYSHGTIPSDAYEYVESDITAVAYGNFLIGRKDLPNDEVYKLTKTAFEFHDELLEIHPSVEGLTLDNVLESPIPLHEGAIRYYEEQSIDIPDELKE